MNALGKISLALRRRDTAIEIAQWADPENPPLKGRKQSLFDTLFMMAMFAVVILDVIIVLTVAAP